MGTLADDLRRSMYLFIRSKRRPVGRDEAAEAVGISRKLAAFHLDKLVEKGLLTAHYTRLSGRAGPGAGRPSKVYEPTEVDVAVSIPSRSYDFAGQILVDALASSTTRSRAAVRASARAQGVALGRQVKRERRLSTVTPKTLSVAQEALHDRGYEPYLDERGSLRLGNCPFHALAQQSVEIVCGLNQAFIAGLLSGLGSEELSATLDPQPGECCARVSAQGGGRVSLVQVASNNGHRERVALVIDPRPDRARAEVAAKVKSAEKASCLVMLPLGIHG